MIDEVTERKIVCNHCKKTLAYKVIKSERIDDTIHNFDVKQILSDMIRTLEKEGWSKFSFWSNGNDFGLCPEHKWR